ncbi:MAG: serine/threonine protein kinase, partial [Planctomycetes bacterium]|nr:serine/threonine protein kinase [Planctomycetota bacterium]
MASRTIGPFQLGDTLGVGGMGIVYRAVHVKTGQEVAVKVLSPAMSTDEMVQKRFVREMEILKRLEHKNIIRYYDGGADGGQCYYAMEIVDGGTLEDLLKKRERLSWEQTIDVAKAIALALEHAHYKGIIHRDLKPANLFLTKKGRLKIGDFGIARDTGRTALTAAGKTVGTYAYMAPEQIAGKPPVSRHTDLYALGCVMFQLLTGRVPFEADNAAEMLMQHLELKPPRVTAYAPDCPIWLERLVLKLLEKDPEDRYYDALAVHTALNEVREKVARRTSITRQTAAGDVTVMTATSSKDKRELKRLLGRDRKKKKRKKVRFYEKVWFLTACLMLLIAGVTWAIWPLSDTEKFDRGQ